MDTPVASVTSTGNVVITDISATTTDAAQQMQNSLINTFSNMAQSSVDTTLTKAGQFASSQEVQDFITEQGLGPYLKDVTKDRVKNILSLFGLWYVTKLFRSKVVLAGAGALAVYVLYTNKDKLLQKVTTQATPKV
jgi:hypothetical protein